MYGESSESCDFNDSGVFDESHHFESLPPKNILFLAHRRSETERHNDRKTIGQKDKITERQNHTSTERKE